MRSTFLISPNVSLEVFEFPGGEMSVKVGDNPGQATIHARLMDSAGVMTLLMIKDALDRQDCAWVTLEQQTIVIMPG